MNFQLRPHLTKPEQRLPFECVALLLQGSPHRPDDQRATKYDSLLLAHVWNNCTGADKY
jgi:hypothetical protein